VPSTSKIKALSIAISYKKTTPLSRPWSHYKKWLR
jgi:hypothetical protein